MLVHVRGSSAAETRLTVDEILRSIRDAIVVLDADRRVESWLGAAQRLFGWSAEEIIGNRIDELLDTHDVNGNPCPIGVSPRLERMPTVKATPEQEFLARTKSGDEVWVGVTCNFERDGASKITRTIAVMRDIRRRKLIDLAKSEVISAVSHELRSPLTSVKGFTSTLLHKWDRFDDETKKHLLFTINTDADRVTRLIGELLDVSRLEAGRLQLRRQMVPVADVAHRVVERIQPRSTKHALSSRFPDGFPEVFCDPDKVEQVLTNLVENAVKYTESGEVIVTGVVEESVVKISVTDHGPGIPPDQRAQVFGKFFRRGETARAENPTGTGLGLYISKGLVEAHGGRIWIEDPVHRGACFAFTLPRS